MALTAWTAAVAVDTEMGICLAIGGLDGGGIAKFGTNCALGISACE